MIDWLRLRLPVDVSGVFPADSVVFIDADGAVKREKRTGRMLVGSHESRVRAFECPVTGRLVIDGNPAKFFQGHNVFGSDDIFLLSHALIWRVLPQLGLRLYSTGFLSELSCADVEVFRVDVTESFSVGCLANARSSVRALSESATLAYRGRGVLSEGTVYFGKHSRRWSLKAYAKGVEILSKTGRLAKAFPEAERIIDFAQPLLRIEAVLRHMELEARGLSRLVDWRGVDVAALGSGYRSGLVIAENQAMSDAQLSEIPQKLRSIYLNWKHGEDLRAVLTRPTFYRYRRALLRFGVDISLLQPKVVSNVVPLVRIIEARPVGIPDWARGTDLLFDRDAKRLA